MRVKTVSARLARLEQRARTHGLLFDENLTVREMTDQQLLAIIRRIAREVGLKISDLPTAEELEAIIALGE
jgi:hypothetical protein